MISIKFYVEKVIIIFLVRVIGTEVVPFKKGLISKMYVIPTMKMKNTCILFGFFHLQLLVFEVLSMHTSLTFPLPLLHDDFFYVKFNGDHFITELCLS